MGESSFVCTFCSKEFANKSRLEIHLKVHTGEKTHICSQCNRAFRTASDLKVHFRTHTGEKPYKCKFCDQAFAVSRNLTAHTRIHTGERPFVCSLCGKAFTQKSALNVHMRIHTGDKPFQCIFCAKQFAYSNSLKMHLKEHTRGALYANSSQNISTTVSTTPITSTPPTTNPSRLSGRKRGRGGRRGGKGNRRKREPFKQDTVLGFSDYTQPEEEHLYTCSICSQGFDQIEVLAEHWKSHNEESDSEKSDDDAESLSSDMPTAESSVVQGVTKVEAGTSESSRNKTFDQSASHSEKDTDSNQTPSIYNNLREIIAKSLGSTQISNGQRQSRINNHDHSAVIFGSAAKLYQSPSLLRGYQTSKSSTDRIFGRLKHPSSISDPDEVLENPTFQSSPNVDSTSSNRVNNENIFGSLASITEKAKDNPDNADVGFFSSPSLSGSFYVGNNASDKKSMFPDQSDSTNWHDYSNNCTSFNNSDDKNVTPEEQFSEKPTTNDNPAFPSLDDSKGLDGNSIKREGSKSSCLIDSKLDIASLFDQDIYTSALNDALKSLPSTTSTSFLNNNNGENTDPLLLTTADVSNSQPLQESQETENSPPSFMRPASTMMASSSMPSIMSMMDNSQLDLLTDTSTPTVAAVTTPSKDVPSTVHTHKCNLCGMVFCDSALFSEHLNKHSKSPNPFMCTECGKQCSRQYDLKVHARTHTGERPYKCKFCNRGFAISRNLVAHLRIHTGERPYKCETCNKSFTQQSALRTHSRIHTGEKPYLCKACGKQFAYSYVLNSHLRNSKLYRCNHCEGIYIGACTMAQHMKAHEDENGKLDPLLPDKKPADISDQLAEPDASRNQAPLTNAKPKRISKRKSAASRGRGKSDNLLSDLCSEFQDQPMPNLDCSELLQNSDLLSKFDDRISGFETKGDNSTKASNFLPSQTLQSKSETLLDQFSPEGYNAQFAEYGEELDKIVVDSLNAASGTLQNPKQSSANSSNQDGGFGGKLSSYLKYAKHLSQRHHAMISRKVKARPKNYICWHCRHGFGLLKDLSKHMVQHWKTKRKYNCQFCSRRFTKQRASVVHRKIHVSKKQFKCDHCNKGFVFASNLMSHQKFKHSLQYRFKPFKCPHCLQVFGRYFLLSTHLKLSHPDVSPKVSFHNSSVDPKILVPRTETDPSSSCDKSRLATVSKVEKKKSVYQRKNSVKKADPKESEAPLPMNPVKRRRVGRQKDKPIVVYVKDEVETDCKRKQKQQPSKDLAESIDMMSGNVSNGVGCNFSCTFCDRTFNQRHQLIVHLRIHTGEKPYKCTWCQKAFRVSNDLNVHTRIHTGYRPYHCKICDKTFTVLRNLSTHMRVHTGERPFQCNICAKRFSQKSALTVHQRIHTGSKPFKCELCPQSFAHSSSLRQHKQRHQNNQAEGKEFWCTICKQVFADYSELVVHLEEHSNNPQGSDNLAENKFKGSSYRSRAAASLKPNKSNYSCQKAGGLDENQSADFYNQGFVNSDGTHTIKADPDAISNVGALTIKADPDAINIMESLKFKALTDDDDDDDDDEDKRQSSQSMAPTLFNENTKKTPHNRASGSRRKKSKVSQVLSPDMSLNVSGTEYNESFHQGEKFQPSMGNNNNGIPGSYSCEDCGKVFSRKCHLQSHSRIHAGEKTNKCEVCGQGFSTSQNLTAHMRIHTGEHPFKCQLCDQTFAYSHSLNIHCKEQHSTTTAAGNKSRGQSVSGKVFKCGDCDQTFAHASMLSVHRRIHKPANQNRGRRRRYSSNQSRVTSDVLANQSEEYLSLSYDESKLSGLAEVQANLNLSNYEQDDPEASEEVSPENGLMDYQSQTTRFGITARMNLRSKQPKHSKSAAPNDLGKDVKVEEYSKEILETLNMADQQNLLDVKDAGNVSSLGSESVCNVCGKSFSQRAHLNAHYRIHTGERPYRCRSCPKAFRVRSDLTVHVRTHTGERPYKCRFCPKAFSISRNLTAHLRTHTGERPFPCQHCSKRFTQKSALTVHLRTHTGVRPYVCMQCGENFAYSHSLKVHMKNHDKSNSLNQSSNATGGRSRRNNVNITPNKLLGNDLQNAQVENTNCNKGKQTSRRNGARNITQSVKQEQQSLPTPVASSSGQNRPYPCQVCGKSFMQNSQLVAHMRIHSGERPYLCRWCPKTFRLSSDLTVHQRIHTGEKPYKCEQCDKTFSISRNLITHMRTHTGERPFQCSCCSKRFTQKSALTVHMRTHTGATPYKCDVCRETFAYSSCLSLHKKHKKAIDCNQCGEVLLGKCAFRSHMQTHETDKTFLTRE